jgi:hypothetical protein
MSTKIQQFLSRFGNTNAKMEQFQALMRQLQGAQKAPRSTTFKPAFTCGFRGWPRTMTRPGSIPAPTIDQVRRLERAYMCKLHVKQGLIYFTDGTPFTHERGHAYRHSVMEEMVAECA